MLMNNNEYIEIIETILPYLDDTGLAKKYTIFTLINRQSNGGIFL